MSALKELLKELKGLDENEKIKTINEIKLALHEISPFKNEPVDCVLWVKNKEVQSNDYNPNSVAPPEMELLATSINEDGYTQPIVAFKENDGFTVIDGFHRNRVGKENAIILKRVKGYLPITIIRSDREDRADRMASTIRHNRARGKHKIDSMSDIVVELKRRNWADERICRELGMEQDEVLRLCQITGLVELFTDKNFSKSWDAEGELTESDFKELTDKVEEYPEEETKEFRTINTDDKNRIFHTYDKWECYKAGFYASSVEGKTKEQCEEEYRKFLSDIPRFKKALKRVITEWKHSCEHYLTNNSMNRIAWLGQASMCISTGVPANFRSGFFLLTKEQQEKANKTACIYLNKWLVKNGLEKVSMEDAISTNQSNIY